MNEIDPRPFSIVTFSAPCGYDTDYPFKNGASYLFISEIVNMPGHCIVADSSGRLLWGYHTDNFTEVLEEEV